MARDYGSRHASRRRKNGPSQLLVIVFSFLVGYLSASIVDFDMLRQWMNKQVLAAQDAKPHAEKPVPHQAELPPKPKFEFYTLLANEKVPSTVQTQATHPAATQPQQATGVAQSSSTPNITQTNPTTAVVANQPPKPINQQQANPTPVKVTEARPTTPPLHNHAYLVQVASFKARRDAEQMKGILTLKGYEVQVVPVSQPQGNWFRVMVGPYANRDLAQQAQVYLAKNERLRGMVKSAG
jgi:cell division protein FtsN